MSFTPSDNFTKRWLDSPTAMKATIHDELSDIITLLKDETQINTFEFSTPDLATKLIHLQTAHLETLAHLAHERKIQRSERLIPVLEKAIDDKLSDKMGDLSDELKCFIRQAIKEELDKETL